jgi:hypothetical protein
LLANLYQENKRPVRLESNTGIINTGIEGVPKREHILWNAQEDKALVQFVFLYKDEQPTDNVWPGMKASHPYWSTAAKYVQETVQSPERRTGKIGMQMVCVHLVAIKL